MEGHIKNISTEFEVSASLLAKACFGCAEAGTGRSEVNATASRGLNVHRHGLTFSAALHHGRSRVRRAVYILRRVAGLVPDKDVLTFPARARADGHASVRI